MKAGPRGAQASACICAPPKASFERQHKRDYVVVLRVTAMCALVGGATWPGWPALWVFSALVGDQVAPPRSLRDGGGEGGVSGPPHLLDGPCPGDVVLGIALDQDEVGTHPRRDAASVGEAECRGRGAGRGGQSRGRGQAGLHQPRRDSDLWGVAGAGRASLPCTGSPSAAPAPSDLAVPAMTDYRPDVYPSWVTGREPAGYFYQRQEPELAELLGQDVS